MTQILEYHDYDGCFIFINKDTKQCDMRLVCGPSDKGYHVFIIAKENIRVIEDKAQQEAEDGN